MSDCTGYGFENNINLCLRGAIGDGNTANLEIQIANVNRYNFDSAKTLTVPNWDGNQVVVDLTSMLSAWGGFNYANCTDIKARLTITPQTPTSGTMLMEFILNGCSSSGNDPQVWENCGKTAGPHIISEMSTFSFDGPACPV